MTRQKPQIKSKYTYVTPDRKHEYFVTREERYDTYFITNEKKYTNRRKLNPFGGFITAEDAQAELERIAHLNGWVCEADL